MKERFFDRRSIWRQRFLAIARELETGVHRRESLDAAVQGVRARFFASRSLRGIRLGCARPA